MSQFHLCLSPWTQLSIEPNGDVFTCCQMVQGQPLGNLHSLPNKDLSSLWNKSRLAQIRLEMINQKKTPECAPCYMVEANQGQSERIILNDKLQDFSTRPKSTNNDGSIPSTPVILSIRLSNVCNLKCRMCGPQCSTSWYQDSLALGNEIPKGPLRLFNSKDELERTLYPLIEELTELNFAGGEPLLIDEHYQLLDFLIQHKKTDIKLSYNSNLTTLTHGKKNILEYWSHFKNISLEVSIDHIEERGEYIRHGQTWEIVTQNIKRCMEQEQVHVFFSPVIQLYNVLTYPMLLKKIMNEFQTSSQFINPIALTTPEYLSIQALPHHLKQEVEHKWIKLKKELIAVEGIQESVFQRGQLAAILSYMKSNDLSKLLPTFQKFTKNLDQLRGESFEKTFPELSHLYK